MAEDAAGPISKSMAVFLFLFTIVQIVLYGCLTKYEDPSNVLADYLFFPDIHVMIFVGFGFLMSFLHKAGFTATSHAFLVAAYSVIWGILNRGFWKRAFMDREGYGWSTVEIGVVDLINADFVAGAVLISFGALLGRVTVGQLLIMSIIEVVFYAMNEAAIMHSLGITDAGGTYFIHMFGAYFGLTTSAVLHKLNAGRKENKDAEGSTTLTDTMAMVGTLFLFVYWPSFNAVGFAHTNSAGRAVVNTTLCITMSTITAILTSIIVDKEGKINMVEVQNSSLSGGVAMGAAAGLVINPLGALITGFVAGIISVCGYRFITPRLNAVVPDTCGVNNLHGMPSILGAIVTAIAIGATRIGSYQGTYGDAVPKTWRSYERNAGFQIVAIFVTLGFAVVGGAISGFILSLFEPLPVYFDDKVEYNLPAEQHGEAPKEDVEMDTKGSGLASHVPPADETVNAPH